MTKEEKEKQITRLEDTIRNLLLAINYEYDRTGDVQDNNRSKEIAKYEDQIKYLQESEL